MTRSFVNGLANFIVEGNLVSFTLTDQRQDGQGKPIGPPQPVSDVVMKLGDFQQMADYLGQAAGEIKRKQGGRPVMPKPSSRPAQPPVQPKRGPQADDRPPLGMKIKPK
jgi:hypothetical protein